LVATTTATRPATEPADLKAETLRCGESVAYFLATYGRIYDPQAGNWIPFTLWPAQWRVLRTLLSRLLVIILKARQLGMTWIVLGYALWRMLFWPAQSVLLFSRREAEAYHLLERLTGMYSRLPAWLQVPVVTNSASVWELANGSVARAFPTNAGDSYTATLVLADEFDLVENQDRLLGSIKPTIDAGGQLILLSRVDKARPLTAFKRIYEAAKARLNAWTPVFLPWSARPDRDAAWYARQEQDIISRTGGKDGLYEQYPATDVEALLPPQLTKRLAGEWLLKVKAFLPARGAPGAPALPNLAVFLPPVPGVAYVIGADPAEGNPGSDASCAQVGRRDTGAHVAKLSGLLEPTAFAGALTTLARWYNNAGVLVERNNHGHAVLARAGFRALSGPDGKPGWLTTPTSKVALYDALAATLAAEEGTVADEATWHQLASIDGNTLNAPQGLPDDAAMAYALMQRARALASVTAPPPKIVGATVRR
jgi:hypothetical protein